MFDETDLIRFYLSTEIPALVAVVTLAEARVTLRQPLEGEFRKLDPNRRDLTAFALTQSQPSDRQGVCRGRDA